MAVHEHHMRRILLQEALNTFVFPRESCCSIESRTHELADMYILLFQELDKGGLDCLGIGKLKGNYF